MLPIKTIKMDIDNHSEIPYQNLKKKKNHKLYQKTHSIKSTTYNE